MFPKFFFKGSQLSAPLIKGGLAILQVAIIWTQNPSTPPPEDTPPPLVAQAIVTDRVPPIEFPHRPDTEPIYPQEAGRRRMIQTQVRNFHTTRPLLGFNPHRGGMVEEERVGPVLVLEPFLHRSFVGRHDINNEHAHLLAEILNNPYELNWMAIMVRLGIHLYDIVEGFEGIFEGHPVIGFLQQMPITYLELLIYLCHYDLAALFLEIPLSAEDSHGHTTYDPILDCTSFYALLVDLQEALGRDPAMRHIYMNRLFFAAVLSDGLVRFFGLGEERLEALLEGKRAFAAALRNSEYWNWLETPEEINQALYHVIMMPEADLDLFRQMLRELKTISCSLEWLQAICDELHTSIVLDLSIRHVIPGFMHQVGLANLLQVMHPASQLASHHALSKLKEALRNVEIANRVLIKHRSFSVYYQKLLAEYYSISLDSEVPESIKKG